MCKRWFINNLGVESTALRQVRAIVDEMTTQEGCLAYYTAMANWDVTDLLADVKTPTLVLGRRDALYPSISVVRSLAAALPNAELVTLEGSGTGITPDAGSAMRAFLVRTLSSPVPAPSAAPPVGGLRTVLFTDIVGHTEMMQRLGDAKGRDVLREHERITRETAQAARRRRGRGGPPCSTVNDQKR